MAGWSWASHEREMKDFRLGHKFWSRNLSGKQERKEDATCFLFHIGQHVFGVAHTNGHLCVLLVMFAISHWSPLSPINHRLQTHTHKPMFLKLLFERKLAGSDQQTLKESAQLPLCLFVALIFYLRIPFIYLSHSAATATIKSMNERTNEPDGLVVRMNEDQQ